VKDYVLSFHEFGPNKPQGEPRVEGSPNPNSYVSFVEEDFFGKSSHKAREHVERVMMKLVDEMLPKVNTGQKIENPEEKGLGDTLPEDLFSLELDLTLE
jgi:hypothetical protein